MVEGLSERQRSTSPALANADAKERPALRWTAEPGVASRHQPPELVASMTATCEAFLRPGITLRSFGWTDAKIHPVVTSYSLIGPLAYPSPIRCGLAFIYQRNCVAASLRSKLCATRKYASSPHDAGRVDCLRPGRPDFRDNFARVATRALRQPRIEMTPAVNYTPLGGRLRVSRAAALHAPPVQCRLR